MLGQVSLAGLFYFVFAIVRFGLGFRLLGFALKCYREGNIEAEQR